MKSLDMASNNKGLLGAARTPVAAGKNTLCALPVCGAPNDIYLHFLAFFFFFSYLRTVIKIMTWETVCVFFTGVFILKQVGFRSNNRAEE